MIVVGLTGGPGSGKTSVADILEDNGAIIISGDEAGHQAVDNNRKILNKLVRNFGKSVLTKGRKLDREKLGKIVFGDPQELLKLNEIVHPQLLKIIKSELKRQLKASSKNIIVIDAALIFEWGIANWCNIILVVTANKNIRIRRMMKAGLTKKEAGDRISSQLPERDKVLLADYVIRNNGTRASLRRSTMDFIKVLIGGQKTKKNRSASQRPAFTP